MKKIIIALTLILAMILCLPSCNNSNEYSKDIETLNTLASNSVKSYTIEIKIVSTEGEKITELYTVKETNGERTVKYRIERLNGFIVDGDNITFPDEYMTVTEGTLDAIESANEKYVFPSFNFSTDNLTVTKLSDHGTYNSMQANVKSIESFTGGSIDGRDAQIIVKYDAYQISSVALSFVSASGNTTTITYTVK